MARVSAVSIDDNLTSRQAGIPMRSADDETAGRIDIIFCFLVQKLSRKNRLDDMLDHVLFDLLLRRFRIVLCRNQNRIDSLNLVTVILDRYLCLAVRSQIFERTVLAHIAQSLCQLMRVRDRRRHQLRRFVAGVAEHQSLVARADGVDRCLVV